MGVPRRLVNGTSHRASAIRSFAEIRGTGAPIYIGGDFSDGVADGKNRAAGDEEPRSPLKPTRDSYPEGISLRADGVKASRQFRHKPTETVEFPHDGTIRPAEGAKARTVYSVWGRSGGIKLKGLRPLVRPHLARRGGHRS